MRTNNSPRSLSPVESGNICGKFTSSPLGKVLVKMSDGVVVPTPMNREGRRKIKRRNNG